MGDVFQFDHPGIRRCEFIDEAYAVAVARSDADRNVQRMLAGPWTCLRRLDGVRQERANLRVIMVCDRPGLCAGSGAAAAGAAACRGRAPDPARNEPAEIAAACSEPAGMRAVRSTRAD